MKNQLCTIAVMLLWSLATSVHAGNLATTVNTRAESTGSFHPGSVWLDTSGKPINAHGGGILFHDSVYYWYGEIKSGKTFLPEKNRSWGGTAVEMGGVSCYSSTNLTDWHNEGVTLAPTPGDPHSDLSPENVLERPKVLFNRSTGKFVMWMHIDTPDYAAARCGVAQGDTPAGPFKYLGSFRPDQKVWPQNVTGSDKIPGPENSLARDFATGQMARDMTLFQDDDGKAYLFYASEDNATIHVSLLTPDYLRTAGKYVRIFANRSIEAPAVFKWQGKYYFIGSGCSGWAPNAAHSAVSDRIFGPWQELGNPCSGPGAARTFQGQGAFILPIAGASDRFIFMADRWKQWDLAASTYLWLPIELSAKGPFTVPWHAAWTPADLNRPAQAGAY